MTIVRKALFSLRILFSAAVASALAVWLVLLFFPERTALFFLKRGISLPQDFYQSTLSPGEPCPASQWNWQDIPIRLPGDTVRPTFGVRIPEYPDTETRIVSSYPEGQLIGSNRGEWGGSLVWRPYGEAPQHLISDNVVAILPTPDGAVVLLGLAHLTTSRGYAVKITPRQGDAPIVRKMAEFPFHAEMLAEPMPGLYATNSNGYVIVFSEAGMHGIADCGL